MDNLHPITVHFPIALLLAAFAVETLALFLNKPGWHRISLWNLCLGALGAGVAVLAGRMAEETAKHSYEIGEVMELHEKLGYAVLGLALFTAVVRWFFHDQMGKGARWAVWALLGIACGVMVFSAHLGGRLVYEFGVGGSYGRSSSIEVLK